MKINYQKGFSLAAMIMAIAAFLGIGAHVTNNMQVKTTDSTAVQTSTTSDWKTYTGSNFSIQYPAGWTITNSSSGVVFVSPQAQPNSADQFSVSVSPIDTTKTGGTSAGVVSNYAKTLGNKVQTSSVMIGDQSGTLMTILDPGAPVHSMEVLFDKGGMRYAIMEQGVNHFNSPEFTKFYQSFKFTSATQSASYNSTNPNMSGGLNGNSDTSASLRAGATNPNMSGGLGIKTGVGYYALPDGERTAKIGSTYAIQWNPADFGTSTITIRLEDESKRCAPGILGCQSSYMIAYGVKNTGVYKWDTSLKMGGSSTGPNSVTVVPGENYKIELCRDYQTYGCEDTDGYFTLTNN